MAYHFIGIKGTGMAALACILHDEHKEVTGSDIDKYIFTEDGVRARNIPIYSFNSENIKDEAPDPIEVQKGCAFKNRCNRSMEICKNERPQLKLVSKDHYVACHLK